MNTDNTTNCILLSPLPRRTVPYPDEDLLSILRRSAAKMGYPDYRWLLRPEGNHWNIKDTDVPLLSVKWDYQMLEQLLLLTEEEVHSHTLHRFAALLEQAHGRLQSAVPQNNSFNLMQLSSKLQRIYVLPIRTIRVCSICLQEQECYDRLYWRLQPIFHCPSHRVRLLEKCPSCGVPIAANRQSAYSCPRCQQAYHTIDPQPLRSANPFYIGERLLLKALGITIQEDMLAERVLALSPLSTLLGHSYLCLLHFITEELKTLFSLQELVLLVKLLRISPPEELVQLQDLLQGQNVVAFLLFHWLFLEWPSHFFTFLETWYSLSTPPFMGEEPIGVLFASNFLFHHPIKPDVDAWLHQAYQEFHRQFRPDPKRTDHLRDTMNRLAQSAYVPPRESNPKSRTMRKQEQWLYIPPRILTSTPPLPWEALGSALVRAAEKVSHPYPEQLLLRPPFTPSSLKEYSRGEPRLPDEASDRTLAYFLQIPEEDIPQPVGPSLIASYHLPRYSFLGRQFELTEQDLLDWLRIDRHGTIRVCPYCIEDQGGYDRVFWNVRGVFCCPRHNARLLERCPACLQDIPAIRRQANCCPLCSSPLTMLPAERFPTSSLLIASTSLLLRMLHIPSAEASSAFRYFGASPLLTVKPSVYFALLIAFTQEMDLYSSFSRQHLLQLCHMLGENTISCEQGAGDPYAVDAEVLFFHTLFSQWPNRFFTFLSIPYQTVHLPWRSPSTFHSRWRWLLTNKWTFIAPDWLWNALKDYERQRPQREPLLPPLKTDR